MGKGTDLWDDSALINAFDQAMASYKAMHNKSSHSNSLEEEKHPSDGNENDPASTENSTGHIESEDNGENTSNDTRETCVPLSNNETATGDLSVQENNYGAIAPDFHSHSSGFPYTDTKFGGHSDHQNMEYDQLLKQYYEIEEKRQKVVQQLHQASQWNYQTSVPCSTSQPQQDSAYNASEHGLNTPCSLCLCHCFAVPLIPTSTCAIGAMSSGGYGGCTPWMTCCSGSQLHQIPGGQCPAEGGVSAAGTSSVVSAAGTSSVVDPMRHSTHADGNAVSAGMMAAERAINIMKMELSATSDGHDEAEKGKDKSSHECNGSQSVSTETDIAAVLNAWYLAGFHTGRYLSEHSRRNANR